MTKKCAGYLYLGNTNTKELHRRSNETPRCQIDEIKDWECFNTPQAAYAKGYDNCGHCMGNSKR